MKVMYILLLVCILPHLILTKNNLIHFCKMTIKFLSRLYWQPKEQTQNYYTKQRYSFSFFSKLSTFFFKTISMDTKLSIDPASAGKHYSQVIFDQSVNYIVTVPPPKVIAKCGVNSIFDNQISKFVSLFHLITDGETKYLNTEVANCPILFNIRHSPRTSHWTNGWVELQMKNLAPVSQ